MKIEDIQLKLYNRLKASGWDKKLKFFLLSKEFETILQTLYTEATNNKRFTPVLKDAFSAFEKCPYDKLKVVIVNNGPYSAANVADGMAFSSSKSIHLETPLSFILDDIHQTVYQSREYEQDGDLTRWAEQGVLLLNMSLTTNIGKNDSHKDLWLPFMLYLFDYLNNYNNGIIYIFFGDNIKHWHKQVGVNNYKLFAPFPVYSYYKNRIYDTNNLFVNVNKILYKLYGEEIIW